MMFAQRNAVCWLSCQASPALALDCEYEYFRVVYAYLAIDARTKILSGSLKLPSRVPLNKSVYGIWERTC